MLPETQYCKKRIYGFLAKLSADGYLYTSNNSICQEEKYSGIYRDIIDLS